MPPAVSKRPPFTMDGPAIFTFALDVVPRLFQAVLDKSGWSLNPLTGTSTIRPMPLCSSAWPGSPGAVGEMVLAMEDIGNTVSSSIPIAIQRYVETGKIRPGHRLVLLGFGVGYSWADVPVTWTGDEEGEAAVDGVGVYSQN